jgi:phosphatidylserine decarboxylase
VEIQDNLNFARQKIWETWGKLRRILLCTFYPEYVSESIAGRKGECTRCGNCCKLLFDCPFLLAGNVCRIYGKRIKSCSRFPIDSRDVAYIECGYSFEVIAKADDGMKIPLTNYAYREILTFLGAALLGMLGAAALFVYTSPLAGLATAGFFALVCGFALYFFRDPQRTVPDEEHVILAPADGKIVSIEEVNEPEFIGGRALKIGIFLSIFNVHINRAPCSGVVRFLKYKEGRFLNALSPKSSIHNEANMVGIEGNGTAPKKVMVKQIAGAIAKRIVCDLRLDEAVENGQKFGMIKFGSRTEVFVPIEEGYEVATDLKTKVRAGVSVLMRKKVS